MSNWTIKDHSRDNEKPAESRAEAEERKSKMVSLGAKPEDIEIIPPTKADGGTETLEPEVVDHSEPTPEEMESNPEIITSPEDLEQEGYDLPERSVSDDPLKWVPGEFVDTIDKTPAINRKGYAVLSHFYKIETSSEVVVPPEETGFEFCRAKAVATTKDGRQYEAHGSAHVDRGDDSFLLLEMADTRAKKRALADATGVGAVAVEELKNEVSGE